MTGFILGVIFVLGDLAAFVGGVVFGWTVHKKETEKDPNKWDRS